MNLRFHCFIVRTVLETECALTCETPPGLILRSLALSLPHSGPFFLQGRRKRKMKRKEERKIGRGVIVLIKALGILHSGSWASWPLVH